MFTSVVPHTMALQAERPSVELQYSLHSENHIRHLIQCTLINKLLDYITQQLASWLSAVCFSILSSEDSLFHTYGVLIQSPSCLANVLSMDSRFVDNFTFTHARTVFSYFLFLICDYGVYHSSTLLELFTSLP